ncbi:MAG TPA: polysaccharide biosynthesis protein, partial [Actinomycetota bacterium]
MSVRPAWVLHWFARAVVPAMRDSAIAGLALWLALQLRFDFNVPQPFAGRWIWLVPVAAGMLLLVGAARGVYRTVPEFAGIIELLRLGEAVAVACVTALVAAKFALPDAHVVPLSVPLIAAMIMFLLLGLVRFGPRLTTYLKASWSRDGSGRRVIVVGAGQAGEMLVRDMLRTPGSDLRPVGFVDDDPAKKGKRIHGLPVMGATQDLVAIATRAGADLCLLAMPSAPSRALRETLGRVAEAGLRAKIIPGLGELVGASVGVADIRDVDIADLIGREPVELDTDSIAGFLERKTVLVTGAAGSIGSELARQLIRFRPATLLLLDNNETDVFE